MTTTHSRKATAVLGWFPTTPATEREVIDMANSRQIALRTRLRHTYWLTDCQPISGVTVNNMRRKMVLIDPKDAMEDPEVAELLSDHYGFATVSLAAGVSGWRIPDLDEARAAAVGSIEAKREAASAAGKRSAEVRAARAAQVPPQAGPQSKATAPEPVLADADDDF